MSKLTKKQRAYLFDALADLEAVRRYIFSGHTAVCHRDKHPSTTLHYTRRCDASVLYEVTREYGSDLCRLNTCFAGIKRLIDEDEATRKKRRDAKTA